MNKLPIKLIKWYQTEISPNSNHKCRHHPTCSNYAITAYQRFNFVKASFLTTKRILTCNPLFKPKYDPVPEKKIRKHREKKEANHD
ncbi:MAG: membrane protein insertion efficiency factor YidD [Acholeplasmataceae bacterium]